MISLNRIISYFDLQSQRRGQIQFTAAGPNLTVFPQYVALVAGIIVQPFLASYQTTGHWNFTTFGALVSWSIFAIITGCIIFPGVYRKAFDPDQPKFVQWCTIVAVGIGWKSLLGAATKVATTAAGS
jgi:hypothetical protein